MKEMFINKLGYNLGQSYYREQLPIKFCQTVGLNITHSHIIDKNYDIYLFQRLINPKMMPIIEEYKKQHKIIIWSIDDSIWDIVETNPCHKAYDTEALDRCNWMAQIADYIIVSTEALAAVVKEETSKNAIVLENLLDIEMWPVLTVKEEHVPRVIWAGSVHHDDDLKLLVKTVNEVIEELKPNIQFLFMGDIPAELIKWGPTESKHYLQSTPLSRYVGFVHGVPLEKYSYTLITLDCQIGLIPLVNNRFNLCKSKIKEWEMKGAGIVPLYNPTTENIISTLKNSPLVDRQKWCRDCTWQHSPKAKYWKDFFLNLSF